MIFLFTLTLLFCVLTESTTSTQANNYSEDNWPMLQHNPAHTGYTTSSAPTSEPTVAWKLEHPKGPYFESPFFGKSVVTNDVVYVSPHNSTLLALNSSSGQIIWSKTPIQCDRTFMAMANGVLYIDGCALAYSASTGEQLWDPTYSSGGVLAVAYGLLYSNNKDACLVCRNASTGKEIWNSHIIAVHGSPAVSGGNIYFSVYSRAIALNAFTGKEVWTTKLPRTLSYSPAVSGGSVYFGCADHNIYCLDAMSGEKIWNYTTGGGVPSTPAVAHGYLYAGSIDGNIYCLNASTGEKIWNYTTCYSGYSDQGIHASPVVACNAVYVSSDDGSLYAFDAYTGVKLWNFTLQEQYRSKSGNPLYQYHSPVIAGGRIFVSSFSGFTVLEDSVDVFLPSSVPSLPSTSGGVNWNILVVVLLLIIVGVIFIFLVLRRKMKNQSLR